MMKSFLIQNTIIFSNNITINFEYNPENYFLINLFVR
jgi:hypothetical protein